VYLSIDPEFEKHNKVHIYDLWLQQQHHEGPGWPRKSKEKDEKTNVY